VKLHSQTAGSCAPSLSSGELRKRNGARSCSNSSLPAMNAAQKLGVSLAAARWEVDNAVDHCRLDAPDRYVRLQVTRLTKALRVVDRALALCDLKAASPR
jgi:hypothetical protein